ncbi:MAG TPA: N,N-dimethylformamidase beta subunit family domain-containing protein, partial [Terriglobales bacterium]|nr:N,N-dimethylformamidase beta subunit family domain-containing protein [Terriglobales bacterium]
MKIVVVEWKLNKRALFILALLLCVFPAAAFASCASPANDIERENCKAGTPQSQWDLNSDGAGDPTIQGFATDISVNVGQTVYFKINTNATAYTIDIYRMGYYGGNGARLVASIKPSASLPQTQPQCASNAAIGLVDCGNWAVSASWQVPSDAVSGIYFAHLIRTDTGGDSHIVFIVRNDASHSAILFQTADESWQAYNDYGGHSLYGPQDQFDLNQRAYAVSYNRPVETRGFSDEAATWVFGAEYPMVRFLEANGYDVTYFTGIDAARSGSLIQNHRLYMSTGHDEYWSGPHRANVEAARDAGVNMAFFSGNEVFWKTRLDNSIDGSNTPNRTLVCYKETLAGTPIDPEDPPTWTGTWRDERFSPPADGGRPENSLTGTLFMVNGPASDNPGTLTIKVPYADAQMRFWRGTSVAALAPGATATLPKGTLGYEWDSDIDNGFRPAGLFDLSTATYNLTTDLLLDQGGTYGAGSATHHLTMYKASSGAIVFGAGTVQWSWGLDSNHDNPFFSPNAAASVAMQQATVNLFADMGVQPATLLSSLTAATASTDTTPPSSTITWPTNGTAIASGSLITMTGTAADSGGGHVGGVEVSVDGGNSWHPASGRESWSFAWKPTSIGSFTLKSRATDDSGNLEASVAGSAVITVNPPDCPCSDLQSSAKPAQVDSGDTRSTEVGVRFRADFDGYITGIRFYKASTNTGTHVGNLWSNTGTLLATATFTGETASGWQQVNFSTPVPVAANTTYVASYFAPAGHYSYTLSNFANAGVDAPPLHFLQDGVDGSNGLYSYNPVSTFPSSSYKSSNYWVDVVYVPASSMPGAPPALLVNPSSLSFAGFTGQANPPAQTVTVYNEGDGSLNWTATSNATWLIATPSGTTPGALTISVDTSSLTAGTYSGTITVSASGATNNAQTITVSLTVTNLLLFSNFADGTMNGWAFSPLGFASNWSVANNALQYNGGGHTQVYAGDSSWTDYTLNVAVKLATLNDYPGGIRGRMNPATGAGYALWLYPAEGLVKLFRNSAWNIDSGLTQLAQGNVKFDATNFHNVQLTFHGSQITVSFDGQSVISVSDATYASGAIALDVSNQVISFTNVMVTSTVANNATLAPAVGSMNFSALYGSNPAAQGLQINSTGGPVWTAAANVPWLSASPAYGTGSSTQVAVSSAGLVPGTYSGTLTFYALGTSRVTQTVQVTLNVTTPPPALGLSPQSLTFFAVGGQSVPSQPVTVTNAGGYGSFSWTASSDSS